MIIDFSSNPPLPELRGETPHLQNYRRVYRAIRSVLSDAGEVEEVMQQTYVLAFSHLAQFHGAARW